MSARITNSSASSTPVTLEHLSTNSDSQSPILKDELKSLGNSTPSTPQDMKIKTKYVETAKQKIKYGDEIYALFMHNPLIAYVNILSTLLLGVLIIYHFYKIFRDPDEDAAEYGSYPYLNSFRQLVISVISPIRTNLSSFKIV